MKILFLAPLTRKITSQITAARPRLIFDLISGLKAKGHQITVLGTGDSKIAGVKIIPVIKRAFYDMETSFENSFYAHTSFLVKQAIMTEKLSNKFDIVHNHCYPEFMDLLIEKNIKTPLITTLHMIMTAEMDDTLSLFPKAKIICTAMAKRKTKKSKIYKTIDSGVDIGLYKLKTQKEDYLLWVGRLGKAKDKNGNFIDDKGVRWAIKLAETTNSKLKLVANVEDMNFFNKDVKPHLSDKIQWIGAVSKEQSLNKKQIVSIMQKAKALLMLSESFDGLVVKEAMSCGTAVIGFPKNNDSTVILDGKTGFLVLRKKGLQGLQKAVKNLPSIKPEDCRRNVEENFSLEKMVDEYEKVYQKVIRKKI